MALAADTEDSNVTFLRTYSISVDMGTESKLFVVPAPTSDPGHEKDLAPFRENASGKALDMVFPPSVPNENENMEEASRICPRALPISDADHAPTVIFRITFACQISLGCRVFLQFRKCPC